MNLLEEAYEFEYNKKKLKKELKLFKLNHKREGYPPTTHFLYAKDEQDAMKVLEDAKHINFCDIVNKEFSFHEIKVERGLV